MNYNRKFIVHFALQIFILLSSNQFSNAQISFARVIYCENAKLEFFIS